MGGIAVYRAPMADTGHREGKEGRIGITTAKPGDSEDLVLDFSRLATSPSGMAVMFAKQTCRAGSNNFAVLGTTLSDLKQVQNATIIAVQTATCLDELPNSTQ